MNNRNFLAISKYHRSDKIQCRKNFLSLGDKRLLLLRGPVGPKRVPVRIFSKFFFKLMNNRNHLPTSKSHKSDKIQCRENFLSLSDKRLLLLSGVVGPKRVPVRIFSKKFFKLMHNRNHLPTSKSHKSDKIQ